MRYRLPLLAIVFLPGLAAAKPTDQTAGEPEPEPTLEQPAVAPAHLGPRLLTWDANLEAGYGSTLGEEAYALGLARARAGLLWVRDPNFFSLGLTYEYSTISVASVGVQAEVMRLDSGLWAAVGGFSDLEHSFLPGGALSLGWSIFGVEAQLRALPGTASTLVLAKVRVPIGVIVWGLSR